MRKRTPTNPHPLLDYLIDRWGFKNDAELGRHLDVAPPVLSKMRHGILPIGDGFRIKVMERCLMTIDQVRVAAGETPYKSRWIRSGIHLLFTYHGRGDDCLQGRGGLSDLFAVSHSLEDLKAKHEASIKSPLNSRRNAVIVDYDSFEIESIYRDVLVPKNFEQTLFEFIPQWKDFAPGECYAEPHTEMAVVELQRLLALR